MDLGTLLQLRKTGTLVTSSIPVDVLKGATKLPRDFIAGSTFTT